ncbi:MAG: aminoacyl-tRNA deacylase [Chloroflexi bacterium]|nr:aminoacyl-tRNA deacylase [Chloroflexota bacterium]
MEKTNAMRLLEQRKVAYTPVTYPVEGHVSAVEVAALVGVPPETVYKTLVVLRERDRPLLVMIAGPRELDPRRLARAIGEKAVHMAPQKEAERLTGLHVGGIGALALLSKPFDVLLDQPALALDEIYVNGGRRGLNLRLRVDDLIRVTGARVVEASEG